MVEGTVDDGIYHTPLGRFSKLDCSTTKRVLIPNGTYSARSRRNVSNAVFFGTDTIPTVEISTMVRSAQLGVICILVSYTIRWGG